MANYTAIARTNKFRIKSVDAFIRDIAKVGLSVVEQPQTNTPAHGDIKIVRQDAHSDGSEKIMLYAYEGWPSFDEDSIADRLDLAEDAVLPERCESLHQIVARNLVDGEVAIFVEIGSEKMRYLGGRTVAVNATGETRGIDLDDILDLAKEIAPKNATLDHPSY